MKRTNLLVAIVYTFSIVALVFIVSSTHNATNLPVPSQSGNERVLILQKRRLKGDLLYSQPPSLRTRGVSVPLSTYDKLEAKASTFLYKGGRKGLSVASPTQTHYAVNEFELSIARSLSFQFSLRSLDNSAYLSHSLEWDKSKSYESFTDNIVCYMDRVNSLNMNHIPHFEQTALPCWSILQQFPNAAHRFIKLKRFNLSELTSAWILDLLEIFEQTGIRILDDGESESASQQLIQTGDGIRILDDESESRQLWVATLDGKPKGGFPNVQDGSKYPIDNTRYFLNESDVQTLQKLVLGNKFLGHQHSPNNANYNDNSSPLRVLIIDRAGGSREWLHSKEFASQVSEVWGRDEIEVRIVSNFHGHLFDQAKEFHKADIIISPHGAQLANLAFIRPCTVVLELFQKGYYLGYFQPLVLSAGGISFNGYPSDRSAVVDTSDITDVEKRAMIRSWPISASPASIVRAFPKLVAQNLSCKRGLERKDLLKDE